jgi:hypothetical protein
MQRVNQTINAANQRLREAVDLTEQRMNEFNALLKVVQQEAEDTFVSTAAMVRGVRKGMETFDEQSRADGVARVARPAYETDDWIEGGDNDGDDSSSAAADRRPGPRIRSRDLA